MVVSWLLISMVKADRVAIATCACPCISTLHHYGIHTAVFTKFAIVKYIPAALPTLHVPGYFSYQIVMHCVVFFDSVCLPIAVLLSTLVFQGDVVSTCTTHIVIPLTSC